ncbi:hypothetical protein [Paenibacillus methanolicus]|uniref:Uncharacterized protein n=1 Tax=Paenibacillus methanolicus TaxID=582686 RepID=A0A5S5C637_9BACL|nr:hypothetical protein [Paenibacillus methanolicus]TYP74787.1 hypothetical protein BCM02_105333 [Paenibacillus methanolicus]
MTLFIMAILCLYMTLYTWVQAREAWKGGNKAAGVAILLLAASFLPIGAYVVFS